LNKRQKDFFQKGLERLLLSRIESLFIRILGAMVIIYTTVLPVFADIYMHIDSKGVLHFSDEPVSSEYKLYIREYPKKPPDLQTTNRYDHLINEAAITYGISFSLLKALIKAESGFDPLAVSKAGAKGLMQIMPENIKAFRIKNPFDPKENIMGGARYFKKLLKRFDGKLPLALAAYNAGPSIVDRYNDIPPFRETEEFVKRVMSFYYVFKKG
jgi:soluble lytic murein transglycosylase